MIRRLPVVATLVVIAAIAILIWLGIWNLQRARLHQAQLASYQSAQRGTKVKLPLQPA